MSVPLFDALDKCCALFVAELHEVLFIPNHRVGMSLHRSLGLGTVYAFYDTYESHEAANRRLRTHSIFYQRTFMAAAVTKICPSRTSSDGYSARQRDTARDLDDSLRLNVVSEMTMVRRRCRCCHRCLGRVVGLTNSPHSFSLVRRHAHDFMEACSQSCITVAYKDGRS